jgi:hypothetical protein
MPQNNFDIFKFCYGNKNKGHTNQSASCNPVKYTKVVTGGNDPSMSSKMRFSQLVKTSRYKHHQNQGNPVTVSDTQPIIYYSHGQIETISQV